MFKHHFPHMGFEDAATIANRRSPNEFPHKMVEAKRGFSAGGRGKFVCVNKSKIDDLEKGHFAHGKRQHKQPQLCHQEIAFLKKKKAESDIGANNGVTMLRR